MAKVIAGKNLVAKQNVQCIKCLPLSNLVIIEECYFIVFPCDKDCLIIFFPNKRDRFGLDHLNISKLHSEVGAHWNDCKKQDTLHPVSFANISPYYSSLSRHPKRLPRKTKRGPKLGESASKCYKGQCHFPDCRCGGPQILPTSVPSR